VRSRFLGHICRGQVFLKLENRQLTNSFKMRGAFNKMLHLSEEQQGHGVITASAGNHGLAVAVAAEKLGIHATIVVPKTTPKVKTDQIRQHEVELILHGDIYDHAEQKATELAAREDLTYVSAYNDELVIAGQGTVGLEILEDLPSTDIVLVPCGGGGLISGVCVAAKHIKPSVSILGVQSEASPVMYESMRAGRIVNVDMKASIADGLFGGIEDGSITFKIAQRCVDDMLLVRERTIEEAIYLLWKEEKEVVEGAGAVSVALILEARSMFAGKTTVAVVSGGNIDKEELSRILSSRAAQA
jgi:threonine dehydratase